MDVETQRRRPLRRFAALLVLVGILLIGTAFLRLPNTPLAPHWNVFEPLDVTAPVTPLTVWKLDWATPLCLSVLSGAAKARQLEDLDAGPNCGIAPRVALSSLENTRLDPVQTSCATALRLAMWEHHGVQPAARAHLGKNVAILRHIGSYNCRPIHGSTTRWSSHSTAGAIDITGFDLDGGDTVRLVLDWKGNSAKAAFLRDVRDASCTWFGTTLGPDYNRLHADHFHLQSRGWGLCQ